MSDVARAIRKRLRECDVAIFLIVQEHKDAIRRLKRKIDAQTLEIDQLTRLLLEAEDKKNKK